MQNNFEKDVQQKMDGLSLAPSAAVWEKVEMEIKVVKRKRRGLFWLLFAGLFLLGGGWWLHRSSEGSSQKTVAKNSRQRHRETTAEALITDAKDKAENTGPRDTGKVSSQQNTSAAKSTAAVEDKTKPVKIPPFVAKRKTFSATQPGLIAADAPANKKPGPPTVAVVPETEAAPIKNRSTKAGATVDSMRLQTIAAQPASNGVDSVTTKEAKKVPLPDVDSTLKKNDSVLKKKMASTNKWRKKISVGAGISGYAEGPFFQSFNGSRDALYASSLSNPGAPVVAPATPSPTKSGFGFSLGFSLLKNMGKRWELSIGLHYAYASVRQKVGDKKTADTTVQFAADKSTARGFYTNTGTTDYTTGFHFVELPVSVSFKPSPALPLYVSVGAAYGRLLSTNALTFSSTSNLYYQNKDNYLRHALPVFSCVQIAVSSKKGLSLRTGPFVQYNAIKLRKEAGNDTPHLLTAGIQTAIIF